uniref:FAS1 domain-containing protein n=1 Tax=Strigamia maritima TaxID=126957 RepID=T1JPA2_STRMM
MGKRARVTSLVVAQMRAHVLKELKEHFKRRFGSVRFGRSSTMRWTVFVFAILVFASLTNGRTRRRKKIPAWHIRMAQQQGPNACVVEEIPHLNKKLWTDCKYGMHRKICGQKTIIRYECCQGYVRVRGERGCTGVKPLRNVLDTAEDLGASIFVQYLYESGLAEQILRAGAITLFAPVNTAFETITQEQKNLLAKSFSNPRSPLLLHHLSAGRVYARDLDAETMLDSMYPDHPLKINRYAHKMVTVNCVPMIRKDQEATNGVVHLIDTLLTPQRKQNVFDAIRSDGRYEELSRLMLEAGVANQLQTSDSDSFTIFAPSDEEFTKIPRSKLEQIRRNPAAMKELLTNHIIPHTICLPAILDEHKMVALSGNKVTLMCNETGIYVDGSRLLGESLTGTNGVVHMVGSMIVPEKVRSIWDLLAEYKLETFAQMAKKSGLDSQLENYGDVTLFAFTDEAFKDLSKKEQMFYQENIESTRDLLRFHIVPGRQIKNKLVNDQKLLTLDGYNTLRIKVYRKGCGVESAMMTKTDIEGMNGVIHIVDRVLVPPTASMVETLQNDGNFSIMLEAIAKARHLDPAILNTSLVKSGSLTLFAPSNEAFIQLGEARLRHVLQNSSYLRQVVKNHIVDNMISSGSFQSKLHYNIQTEQNIVEINKRAHGIRINSAAVTRSDIVTRDGIVHVVDHVLLPDEDNHLYAFNHF